MFLPLIEKKPYVFKETLYFCIYYIISNLESLAIKIGMCMLRGDFPLSPSKKVVTLLMVHLVIEGILKIQ